MDDKGVLAYDHSFYNILVGGANGEEKCVWVVLAFLQNTILECNTVFIFVDNDCRKLL